MMELIRIGKYEIAIFNGELHTDTPILYTHLSKDTASDVAKLVKRPMTLAAIDGADWERELSPWKAERAFKGGEDFAGEAGLYINTLTSEIIPMVERYAGERSSRGLVGYSMAGLFAVYAMYKCDAFDSIASVSGSLWYDGFTDFMSANCPARLPKRAYFSLGLKESAARNPRLASVGRETASAVEIMRGLGVITECVSEQGGHFDKVPERIAGAIDYCAGK